MASLNQTINGAARIEPIEIDDDAPEWTGADIAWPKAKERVTVRFDQDVLEFFRREGKGYQTRMNAVLRSYIKAKADRG